MRQLACYLFFPKCGSESGSVIVPCQEAAREMEEGCVKNMEFAGVSSTMMESLRTEFDSTYLPSRFGGIDCFYEPVLCEDNLPNVTGARIVKGVKDNGSYVGGHVVEYACAEDLELIGNSSVRCLYSGQWSEPPRCVPNILLMVLPPVALLASVVALVVVIRRCRKRRRLALNDGAGLTRALQYDAFLCFCFTDYDYVQDVVIPELQAQNPDPPFILCNHEEDFEPGTNILDNITAAISDSIAAIIVMSQAFIDSPWCQREFDYCLVENINDPAFKLLVILTEPAERLINMPPAMKNLHQSKDIPHARRSRSV